MADKNMFNRSLLAAAVLSLGLVATANAQFKNVTVNGEHTVFDSATTTYTTTGDVTITSATAVEVVAYVYIDGNGTNVNSKYVADGTAITGSLDLKFDLV